MVKEGTSTPPEPLPSIAPETPGDGDGRSTGQSNGTTAGTTQAELAPWDNCLGEASSSSHLRDLRVLPSELEDILEDSREKDGERQQEDLDR